MKTWQKFLAMLMALTMVFALAACDKDSSTNSNGDVAGGKTESVAGTWSVEIDLFDLYYAAIVENAGIELNMNSSLVVTATFEFTEGGAFEYTYSYDENDLLDIKDEYWDGSMEYLYELAEAEGMTKEELMEAYEAENGTDLEDDMKYQCETEIDTFAEDLADICIEGYYKYADGKIYLAEDKDDLEDLDDAYAVLTVEVDDDELKIEEIDGEIEEIIDMMPDHDSSKLPWELEKQ